MGVAGSPLRDRVIFVEGAPRSGTTWLVTLLATHPDIAGVDAESHLFDFGVDRVFDNFEGRDPDMHGLRLYLDRDELVDLVRDFCDGVLLAMRSHLSDGPTPPFVVEKTPIAAKPEPLDLARKRECYPDAWYIHIVRDREAVTRSLMRSPWVWDRSYERCSALWELTVGHARATLGDLPRYREVSYEELRADPAEACRGLFEWLGVSAGDEVLETVRVLSREPYSDLGAVVAPPPRIRSSLLAIPRRRMESARTALRRRLNGLPDIKPGSRVTFLFARALHERDAEMLRSLTAPSLELVYRSAEGDMSRRGDDARAALVRIAEDAFKRRYAGEWWASADGGSGEWWSSAPGKPFWTVFFSGLASDATRVDIAIGLVLEEELVRRAVVISAGPLTGRPVGPDVVSEELEEPAQS
jgi:hypothetical protein